MLSEKLRSYHIILASGSPRRQQFLKDLGIDFEVRLKKVDEIYPSHLKATEITDFLADLKSKPFDNELAENDLLITSDTIVWLENQALGKPATSEEAFLMLRKLSGTTHSVITSISIKTKQFQKICHDTTEVTFKPLSDDEIRHYINQYHPYDKAGGYGIQEWIGKIGITNISGNYYNVMGLPVHKLYKELINL